MALSPTADERGRRVLAVAGFGVEVRHGNIGLFHFPGSNAVPTGDAGLHRPGPEEQLGRETRADRHRARRDRHVCPGLAVDLEAVLTA